MRAYLRAVKRTSIQWALALATVAGAAAGPPDPRDIVAAARDVRRVIVPPGTYRLAPRQGGRTHWTLAGLRDVEIVADGVTLVCTERTRALHLEACRNVAIRGLTIDYDPPPFTQGTIVAVASNSVDVRIDDGYPVEAWSRIEIVDPASGIRKRGMPFLWGATAERRGADTVRVTHEALGRAAAAGDRAVLSAGPGPSGIPHGIVLERCAEVTLDRVTLHAAPGMGILDVGGDGGTRLAGCRVVPGPPPPGATAPRLLSTSWDAIQHKLTRRGPKVTGCTIEHAGDDSWSVQSSSLLVLARDGRSIVLASEDDGPAQYLQPGDRLRDPVSGASVRCETVEPVARADAGLTQDVARRIDEAPVWSAWHVGRRWVRVRAACDVALDAGRSLLCDDRRCNDFLFRGNTIRSPGRGALVKASDGLIESNVFENVHAAVVVDPEVPDGAAAEIERVVIRHNLIDGSGEFCPAPWSPQAGAIVTAARRDGTTLRSAGAIRSVAIEFNGFRNVAGVNVALGSLRGVLVRGNRFERPGWRPPPSTGAAFGVAQTAVVWIARSLGVGFEDNVVTAPGPHAPVPVAFGPDTTNLIGLAGGMTFRPGGSAPQDSRALRDR